MRIFKFRAWDIGNIYEPSDTYSQRETHPKTRCEK